MFMSRGWGKQRSEHSSVDEVSGVASSSLFMELRKVHEALHHEIREPW